MAAYRDKPLISARRAFLAFCLFAALTGSARGDSDLLKNGDFERRKDRSLPQNWVAFSDDKNRWTGELAKADASDGSTSVYFAADKSATFQGLYQPLRVKKGASYEFSVRVKTDPERPLQGASYGQLSIEWYDAQNREISRSFSQSWSGSQLSSDKWMKFVVGGSAPDKALKAHFVITIFTGGESNGGFLVDDASATKPN